MTQAENIGISCAEGAFDFAADCASLEESIDSHYDNVGDTLREENLLNEENFAIATKAFYARVKLLAGSKK